jgi:hypothetical protein
MEQDERFQRAVAVIDAANAQDPVVIQYRDEDGPKELIHSELLTRWVKTLLPSAGEAVLLAARAQHLRRWMHPRSEYPEGRSGYLRWRTQLYKFHAEEAAKLLREAGYDEMTIARTGQIIRKEGLGRDPDVQAIEDGLCLVFLELQLDELAGRLDREKMLVILRKTWRKMSAEARKLALDLAFEPEERELIGEALESGA